MFQKNMEALKSTNPELVKRLEKINFEDIQNDISVHDAQSGDLVIAYKGNALNSIENPVKEAQNIWYKTIKNELLPNDIQVVFGLGLGYLFKRAFVSAKSKVYLYEPITEVLRFVLHHVDFSNEISEKRVFITDSFDELFDKLNVEYLSGDKIEVLYTPVYAAMEQDKLINVVNKVLVLCQDRTLSLKPQGDVLKEQSKNSILNLKGLNNSASLNSIKDKFKGKTALIIDKDKSLESNIEKIKANSDKFIKISTLEAYETLQKNNLNPDFVVIANGANNLNSYNFDNTNIIYDLKTSTDIALLSAKNKFVYFSEENNIVDWVLNVLGKNSYKKYPFITDDLILGVYSTFELGFGKIAFVGVDFISESGIQVQGIKDKAVITSADYLLKKRTLEEALEKVDFGVELINISDEGVLINGLESKSIDDLALGEVVACDVKADKTEFGEGLLANLIKIKNEIFELSKRAETCLSKAVEIKTMFENNENISIIEQKLKDFSDNFIPLKTDAVNNLFVISYMQREIFNYTKNYNTSLIQNIEEIKQNFETDMDLVQDFSKNLSDLDEII